MGKAHASLGVSKAPTERRSVLYRTMAGREPAIVFFLKPHLMRAEEFSD
jgi:hypothetical protein